MRGAKRRSNLPGQGKQSGYLLLPVAVAIALIGVIAFLISSESAIEVDMTANELEAARAEYVAQAGLQHALREHAQQGCGPYSDLNQVAFGNDEYDTKLTHDLGGTVSYSALTDQDTWIRNDIPAENKASDVKLHVRFEAGNIERPMYRYDLSSIPAKAAILSARAWFYVVKEHPQGPIDIHLITADWIETDATWDSMGSSLGSAVLASIPAQSTPGVWVSVNMTAQVQAWINGQPNNGITLNSTSEGTHAEYGSRESATESYIEVLVGTPATSPAVLRSTGKTAGGGATLLKRQVVLNQSPASYRQLRLDAGSGKDVMLDAFYNNRNHGDYELKLSSDPGWLINPLLQFDLGTIPAGAKITSAELELYHKQTNGGSIDPAAGLHRITRDWVEGTRSGGGTADGATWDTWDGSNAWTNLGGDFDVTPVSRSTISATTGDWESWDATALVQGWVDGSFPNYGMLLKPTGDFTLAFASREDADPSSHPRLSVTYRCECGQACVAPQGSGKIALIGDDASPDPDDQIKIAIIESWGYDVDFYEDQAADTINWSNYDLAYVSETTISSGFSGDPAIIPIGVVNEEPKLYDEFLLASGDTEHVGDTIDIVDNSHYITSVFPQGPLPIYTGAMEILSANTPLAADLQTLGEFSGAASLTALEKGAMTTSGTGAAARRVTLPLGQHFAGGFDWSKLNSNGYLLVQRAIQWGAGLEVSGCGSLRPLLLVVGSDSPLASSDDGRKTLMESWCYDVTVIDDGTSQAEFDAAAAAAAVVFVSGTVGGGTLANKLTGSPAPIVNEFYGKLDNYGFSSSTGTAVVTDSFTVTNAAHYISESFAGAAVTVFSSSLAMQVPGGTLAPDLETVGETTGPIQALVTLDAGATRWDGSPAPARRVHLPFAAATVDQMTDDGKTLMRRALEWAGGANLPDLPTQLLFVVPDPASLGAADAAKKTLFESWSYTVNLIDDAAPLADFQAAIVANDVAYVSATAVASSVGSKLFKADIGVVNANSGLHDDFGFSTVRYISSTNAPLNTVASHYITQPFGGGQVTLYTSDQTSGGAVGTLAADLDQIGLWSSGGMSPLGGLVTLETGAMTSIGENTPARRAQMPWDNLDVSELTADGLTILQRAIEWAGGAEIDLGPVAHWKLDDAPGPTAIDSIGGNDATLNGNPDWTTGVVDGALEFDGSGDYATTDSNFTPPPVGTVLFWMKVPGSPASHGRILGLDDTWEIRHVTTGTPDGIPYGLVFDLGVSGVNTEFVTTVTVDAPDQWYFIAATYDTNNDAYQVYLDGALHKSGSYPSSLAVPAAAPLSLGTRTGSSNYFTGTLDDVQIFNRILSASEIADLYAAGAPPAPGYIEVYEPWDATANDTWQTVDLAGFGVPADAVVEVAVLNDSGSRERWGGVRAVGSTLDRRLRLQEAESGGTDVVTMHVQADAGSQIQHYSDATGDVRFILLGYWTGASYVELFETFSAGSSNSWEVEKVDDEGLGANQVAEVVIVNTSTGNERLAGVRPVGATFQRRFMLHDAQGGGVDAVTMMVTTNDDEEVEVYASNAGDVDFYVIGYWDTPPGTYTATGGAQGSVSAPINWETIDLSAYGVPANSIAQFVLANENQNMENSMRLREVGSTINNRALLLHEAEGGGSDLGSLHANVDASSRVQWAAQLGSTNGYFYPVGWWVLSP